MIEVLLVVARHEIALRRRRRLRPFVTVCWNSMFMNRYIGLVLMTKARAGSRSLALKCWWTQLLCTIAMSPAFQS